MKLRLENRKFYSLFLLTSFVALLPEEESFLSVQAVRAKLIIAIERTTIDINVFFISKISFCFDKLILSVKNQFVVRET